MVQVESRRKRAWCVLGVATLLGGPVTATAADAPDQLIVFESVHSTSHHDLWVMSPDGTGLRQLTDDKAEDVFPAWSPDGSRIAWTVGGRTPAGEIHVMNTDGTGRTRLTYNAYSDYNATWSPDGTKIAFRSNRDGNRDIYVINADGTGEQRLTDDPAADFAPDWSPDGTRISFTRDSGVHPAVWSMAADGSDEQQLTAASLNAGVSGWSPDGSRIVFADSFCATCGESDLFVMNADGSGVTQVTDTPENELATSWSPDGTQVVIDLGRIDGAALHKGDIALVDVATGATTRLTTTPGVNEEHPSWSP
ncbi:MAG TPA: LpqB family beta-propeller domain-containing protein [Dermatophilaceae bacterium]|nr:LpqB family beta-propeller domain-containing protein [Dermatophilaceae bacterium]